MLGLSSVLCVSFAWFLVLSAPLQAQQPAPVPPQILNARRVFVSNAGGSNYFDIFTGGPDRAYTTLYADLELTGRYQLVDSPAQAELVFQIRAVAPAAGDFDNIVYNPQIILRVLDPRTSTVLWTTRANVRAAGTQKHRDRGFDQSIAVLVDKLSLVTGHPLTPAENKAIRRNQGMPAAAKILMIVGMGAAAGFTAWGLYRATHPAALPQLPQPSLPAFPAYP